MSGKLTKCKACGAEIAKSAKMCPQCGSKNKKPFYTKIWFWLIIVVVIVVIGSSNGGENNTPNTTNTETSQNNVQENIEYTKYDVSTMVDDLENNAMNAKNKYDKQYVEVTGELTNIDSSGSYISLSSTKHEFSFLTVQCFIKNEEQLNKISQMATGNIVTIRGKVKSVGEVLGYSLDITEIP